MATEFNLISGEQSAAPNAIEIFFTAAADTKINKFSATNDTGVNRSYRAYIYTALGTVNGSVIPTKFVTSLRGFDLGPALVGQIVPAGGTIRIESSSAAGLVFRAVGELTEG